MKILLSFIFLIGLISSPCTIAEQYKGDGAWAVMEYGKNTTLVHSVDIYRKDSDKGARPTFMLNYGGNTGCHISLGLTMFVSDIQQPFSKQQMLSLLKTTLENSDFIADSQVLKTNDDSVQALDMGGFIFVRKLINADSLAAFMLAKTGTIKIRNQDLVIKFNMYGFKKTIDKIVATHCK